MFPGPLITRTTTKTKKTITSVSPFGNEYFTVFQYLLYSFALFKLKFQSWFQVQDVLQWKLSPQLLAIDHCYNWTVLCKTYLSTHIETNYIKQTWKDIIYHIYFIVFSVSFKFKLYCNDNYFGSACATYCKAQNSNRYGHYTCHPDTGAKQCRTGEPRVFV